MARYNFFITAIKSANVGSTKIYDDIIRIGNFYGSNAGATMYLSGTNGNTLNYNLWFDGNNINQDNVVISLRNLNNVTYVEKGSSNPQQTTLLQNAANIVQQGNIFHRVVAGDTLSKIAAKYHTTVQSIAALNGISNVNVISVGQVLRVSGTSNTNTTNPQTIPTQTPVYTNNNTTQPPAPKEDSLFASLQKTFGTTGLIVLGLGAAAVLIVATQPRK